MFHKGVAVLMVVALFGACGGDEATNSAPNNPSPAVTFASATALIDTQDGSVLIDVEIAETDLQRQTGLMNRESLEKDSGMIFIYFKQESGGFWMKDTLIPLSIAFFDIEGKILKILDMTPCKADPCKIYDPGIPYMGALEVNQGAFDEWGVAVGDTVRVNR
jgi:uncharacterized protein